MKETSQAHNAERIGQAAGVQMGGYISLIRRPDAAVFFSAVVQGSTAPTLKRLRPQYLHVPEKTGQRHTATTGRVLLTTKLASRDLPEHHSQCSSATSGRMPRMVKDEKKYDNLYPKTMSLASCGWFRRMGIPPRADEGEGPGLPDRA